MHRNFGCSSSCRWENARLLSQEGCDTGPGFSSFIISIFCLSAPMAPACLYTWETESLDGHLDSVGPGIWGNICR
jgi:hypothetical protein